jgi:hypothetical protein
MGELVGFDPDMPQWEGDGQLVGVRSQLIVTHTQEFVRPYGYKSNYMSQVNKRHVDGRDHSEATVLIVIL